MAIRSDTERIRRGRRGRGGGDAGAHLRILQAPQAENCSREVFGFASGFWRRREAEEEEPSEGEPELCLIGIIDEEKRKREKEERERKMREGGGTLTSLSGRLYVVVNPTQTMTKR